jgi:small nuclear ribonucleoprotein D3
LHAHEDVAERFDVCAVSVTGKRGVGIPTILLHDAEGGIVTVQLKNGDVLRGVLSDTQDNMNTIMQV